METTKITTETTTTSKDNAKGPLLGIRHLQAGLLFLDIAILYINRLHIAVTVVAMTNAEKSNPDFPEYNWNEKEKSWILSSFYWGYVLTQFPGGFCVRRFGVKLNLFIYTLSSGLFSLLVPLCVPWGNWRILCLLRFAQGLFQGGVYPAMQQHLAKWSPPAERSRLSGFAHTGFDCGIVLAMGLSGIVAASSLGWPGMFYISAALSMIWCVLWLLFGANDAAHAKFITSEERAYIETSLAQSVHFEKKRLPVPWRAIFTSVPFYALIVVRSASEVGFFTIQAEWPSYINAVLKMNIKDNALFSALPALVSWIFVYFFMFIADVIRRRNLLTLTATRKCFNSLGMWIPAAGIIMIGYLNEAQNLLAVILMTFMVAIHSSIILGCILCPVDMAPNHAGIVVSIMNTITNLAVMLGPLYVGVVVNDESNRAQWQIVFTTAAILFCIGDLIFLVFGSAQEQPWNATDFLKTKGEIEQNEMDAPGKVVETNSTTMNLENAKKNLSGYAVTNQAFVKEE